MNIDLRFPSNNLLDYEATLREAVKTGNAESIRTIQKTFQNLTLEEQKKLQVFIDEVFNSATEPAKAELRSLRETINLYHIQDTVSVSGVVNLSTGTPVNPNGIISTIDSNVDAFYLSDSEYTNLAQDVIRDTPESEIVGKREVYLFQKYFNQIHQIPGFSIDGISGSQTISALKYHSRATAIFLREIGASGENGGTLNVRDTFTPEIMSAIKTTFGVTLSIDTPPNIDREVPNISTTVREILAKEILGEPLTEAKIRTYQTEHNIEVDGILGNETYFEMQAEKLKKGLESNIQDINWLQNNLETIRVTLQNATPTGRDIVQLRLLLDRYKTLHESKPEFTSLYGDFYREDMIARRAFAESEDGQVAISEAETRTNRDGRSIYEIATDPDLSNSEKAKALLLDPVLLIGGGIMFLFGVFGSNTKYTNSFFKRLGVILGLTIGGPLLLDKIGVWDMLDDTNNDEKAIDWFNGLGSGGNPTERVTEAQRTEGSPLRELFPSNDFYDATMNYFAENEAIKSLSLESIQTHITALRNNGEVPDFLKDITILGQKLSNEQIAGFLESLYQTKTSENTIFGDLFEGYETVDLVGGGIIGASLIGGLVYGFPPLALIGVAAGASTLVVSNWEYIRNQIPFLQTLDDKISNNFGLIQNEEIRTSVQNIFSSNTLSLQDKIQQLTTIASENSEYSESIKNLITLMIEASVEVILESIKSVTDIKTLKEIETSVLPGITTLIQTHVTDTEKSQALIESLMKKISERENEIVQGYSTRVENIDGNIKVIEGNITALRSEQENLLLEQATASIERIGEIDLRLSQIPGEIANLEVRKLEEGANLEIARKNLSNIMVENYLPVVDARISFLTVQVTRAIELQGVKQALEGNYTTLKSIEDNLGEIETAIEFADSSEKSQLVEKISQARQILASLKEQYRTAVGSTANITAESVRDINLEEKEEEIQATLAGLQRENVISEFFGITRQDYEEAIEIYKAELERQLEASESNMIASSETSIIALRAELQKYRNAKQIYNNLFGIIYENPTFDSTLAEKQNLLKAKKISEIPGFVEYYRTTIRNLETASDEEKTFILNVLTLDPTFTDLEIFFREQVLEIAQISEGLETVLSTSTLEVLQQFITY